MPGVYDDFYKNISDEAWEFFAVDFLCSKGFIAVEYPSRGPDGGKDAIVELNGKYYIVSCKHYFLSGKSVGVQDEISILDRVVQHRAKGFIGFYSTVASSSLNNRISEYCNQGYDCMIFDVYTISDILPSLPGHILQKYAYPSKIRYAMNVSLNNYLELNCLICGADILLDEMIPMSMASVALNKYGELIYLYGCKYCIGEVQDMGWVPVSQVLYLDQFNAWVRFVHELVQGGYPISMDFYRNKSNFESLIHQKAFPSNWGTWF